MDKIIPYTIIFSLLLSFLFMGCVKSSSTSTNVTASNSNQQVGSSISEIDNASYADEIALNDTLDLNMSELDEIDFNI